MTDEKKPRYELRPRSKNFVGLWEGKHCLCAICTKTTRGALDAQLILLVMNSHKDLLAACERASVVYDYAICRTPTGDERNKLCEQNILRMAAIQNAKPKPEQESTL